MKYRRLRNDELEELEVNFIRFLAAHTVGADDWERVKRENPEEAERLIEKFSDVVFEKTLKNLQYLQFKTPRDIKVFKCLEDKILLMGLTVEGQTNLDFTKNDEWQTMLQQVQATGAELKVYRAEKAYKDGREVELFKMMEQGCLISDGSLYEALVSMVK